MTGKKNAAAEQTMLDCLILTSESEVSRNEAALWKKAAEENGFSADAADKSILSECRSEDGVLRFRGRAVRSLIFASVRRFTVPELDLMLNFVLFGGFLAASGPRIAGTSAVDGDFGGRPRMTVREEISRIENYTSRTDPWDEINAQLLAAALPGLFPKTPEELEEEEEGGYLFAGLDGRFGL